MAPVNNQLVQQYSNPFYNASAMNEGGCNNFANLALKISCHRNTH